MLRILLAMSAAIVGLTAHAQQATQTPETDPQYWLKVHALNKFDRTAIAQTGASIEITGEDYVIAIGSTNQRARLEKLGVLESSFVLHDELFDFPTKDASFHNFDETKTFLSDLATRFPTLTKLDSIGKSLEGREIFRLRISGDLADAASHPGIVYMGGHHAREHLSVEIPLLLAQHLLESYATDADIKRLVDSRDIQIVPLVNPDGSEYDVSGTRYKMWRKNRAKNADGTAGVDLNRNYGFGWGEGGSSTDGSDETYMGPHAFSEPETIAVRDFIDANSNITMLLTFHTFSELILYPWGHTYDSIADARDHAVFETMGKTMAQWNGYTPQQSSALYLASGDTTDWAYGEKKIFAFTFEMDPTSMLQGGFYPGQAVIPDVFAKNLKPCLYMMELADNPYRALNKSVPGPVLPAAFGMHTPLIQ